MEGTQSVSIEIPENLSDIKLSAYKKFILLANEENGDEIALHQFCGLTPAQQKGMKKKDLDAIRNQIGEILVQKPALTKTFMFKGKEYGFHPKIEDISMGEYVDLEEHLKDPYKNAEKVLGVLYRPITKKMFGRYSIENYDPEEHDGLGFQDLSAEIFIGCLLFFYRIATELQITFLQSLEKDQQRDMMLNLSSAESGDGMERYIRLLKEISYDLRR